MIDIDKLDNLPLKESISKGLIREYGSLYDTYKYEYRRYIPIAKKIRFLLKRFLNKPFNDFYSEYKHSISDSINHEYMISNYVYGFRNNKFRWRGDVSYYDFYIDDDDILRIVIKENYRWFKRTPRDIKITKDYQQRYYEKIDQDKLHKREVKEWLKYKWSIYNFNGPYTKGYKAYTKPKRKERWSIEKYLERGTLEDYEKAIKILKYLDKKEYE